MCCSIKNSLYSGIMNTTKIVTGTGYAELGSAQPRPSHAGSHMDITENRKHEPKLIAEWKLPMTISIFPTTSKGPEPMGILRDLPTPSRPEMPEELLWEISCWLSLMQSWRPEKKQTGQVWRVCWKMGRAHKNLPTLENGDSVVIQNGGCNTHTRWDLRGKVVQYNGHDQYDVMVARSRRITMRNGAHLNRNWCTNIKVKRNIVYIFRLYQDQQ